VLEIPVVSAKLAAAMQAREITPVSYKQREALNFLSGLPRFELFRLSEAGLERILAFFLDVVDQPRTEVELLAEDASGTLRVLVALPGREFPQARVQRVRERVESLFNLTAQNVYTVQVSTFGILGLVFYHAPGALAGLPAAEQVDEAIREELLSRDDRLARAVTQPITEGKQAEQTLAMCRDDHRPPRVFQRSDPRAEAVERDTVLRKEARAAHERGSALDRCPDAAARHRLEALDIGGDDAALERRRHHRLRERMLRGRFGRSGDAEELRFRAPGRLELAQAGLPLGERSGLVEHHVGRQAKPLERFPGAHQDAALRRLAGAAHDCERRRDSERAGVAHHQHREAREHGALRIRRAAGEPRDD